MKQSTYFRCCRMCKVGLFLTMALMIILLSGCTPADTQVSIAYSEENSQYGITKDLLHTETTHAGYYFEQAIDKSLRQDCMKTTDSIIAKLVDVQTKPQIYIFSDTTFNGVNIIGNSLYTCQINWQSVDYATNVILATYGECTHYGLAYGYATVLCEKFGWEGSDFLTYDTPEVLEAYDLNLLCFDDNFLSDEDILVARKTACKFVNYLIEKYSEDIVRYLLSISHTEDGMVELTGKLSEYYATHKINYLPSLLRFGYGGISYDYILRSEFGTFYIGADWIDANRASNPLVSDRFLHKDYKTIREFFERNLKQMASYQNLFDLGDYDNQLKIIFPNSRTGSQYSYYQAGYHQIIVFNVDSMMHEYVHALTKPKTSQKLWETEGFARYFSYYYDYYGIAFLNNDYNTAVESKATEYLFEFKRTIDRSIDMHIDFKELENIAVYSRNYTDPNASYVAGSSFVQYLVQVYGETFVAQCVYGDENFSTPYSELVDEWNRYIENNYSEFSRYNG